MRRLSALGVVAGVIVWWLRLLAHSKHPPPEGRWQELRLEDT